MSASFTSSQDAGNPRLATFTDTSTGVSITGRLLYLRKYDGTYLVPEGTDTDYILWDASEDTISVDVLDKDYCLDVTMVMVYGSTIADTATGLVLFTAYSELFLRQLTQALASNRTLLTNANYWENKIKLRTLLDDAAQAVALINDQTIATFCLDEAKKLTDNIQAFY
jgi:Ca2+-binding RTX toxin-like protein